MHRPQWELIPKGKCPERRIHEASRCERGIGQSGSVVGLATTGFFRSERRSLLQVESDGEVLIERLAGLCNQSSGGVADFTRS